MMLRAAVAVVVALAASAASAKARSLESLQGDVTVVAFFSTACAPCKAELPMVEALRASLAGDARVRVVTVSVDDRRDATRARTLARKLGVTAPVLVDARAYAALFGGGELAVPRLAVIDRKRGGLERMGARAGETRDDFVREVTAAIASVEAGAPAPPTPMWQLLGRR